MNIIPLIILFCIAFALQYLLTFLHQIHMGNQIFSFLTALSRPSGV